MAEQTAAGGETRSRILAAALELFYRQGFRGTTVREITLGSGITPGALYNHFASKEDLLFTLVLAATEEGEQELLASLEAAGSDPEQQLRAVMYASCLWNTRHRSAALVAAIDYIHLPESQRRVIIQRRRQLRERLVDILEKGEKQKCFSFPDGGGKQSVKLVATALANIALRASELFGPTADVDDEDLAHFHAQLALQTVGVIPRRKKG